MLSRKALIENIMTGRRCVMSIEDYRAYKKRYGRKLFKEFNLDEYNVDANCREEYVNVYIILNTSCEVDQDCCDNWNDWYADMDWEMRWGDPLDGEEDDNVIWITPQLTFMKAFWKWYNPYDFDIKEEEDGKRLRIQQEISITGVFTYRLTADTLKYIKFITKEWEPEGNQNYGDVYSDSSSNS
jgi:hypothetical protein